MVTSVGLPDAVAADVAGAVMDSGIPDLRAVPLGSGSPEDERILDRILPELSPIPSGFNSGI